MFKKSTATKSENTSKPVSEENTKLKKQKKDKKGLKVANEKSQLAQDLGIRISNPYGYYPDDVDPIIAGLQKSVSDLTKENKRLADELNEKTEQLKLAMSEASQLKMQMSLMEIPDMGAEEEFTMLSRIDSITGNYNSNSVADMKLQQAQQAQQASTPPKQPIKLKLKKK